MAKELEEAIDSGNEMKLLQMVHETPALLRRRNGDGRTILQQLITLKHLSLAERLLTFSQPDTADVLDVNNADDSGWTALHQAASVGLTPLVERLLQLGARVDAQTRSGQTPLHYAAGKGQLGAVGLLLRAGARPDAEDRLGQTAVHRAATLGRTEAVVALLAHTPTAVNQRDGEGNTAL